MFSLSFQRFTRSASAIPSGVFLPFFLNLAGIERMTASVEVVRRGFPSRPAILFESYDMIVSDTTRRSIQ